jgi:hypothetical protein
MEPLVLRLGLALVLPLASAIAQGNAGFRGSVANIGTAHPVSMAEVRLVYVDSAGARGASELFLDSTRTRVALTDSTGAFQIRAVDAGHYLVSVHRLGFEPFQGVLTIDTATVEMELALTPVATRLPEVRLTEKSTNRVTDRLEAVGFTRRAKSGNVLRTMDREKIVAERSPNTHSLLERWGMSAVDRFLLDGLPVDWRDLKEFPIDLLVAFEVYRSPEMLPVEFTQTLPGRQTFKNPEPPPTFNKEVAHKQPDTAAQKFPERVEDPSKPMTSRVVLIWTYVP